MRIKEGFILRQLANEPLVVAIGEAGLRFNGLIRLNETGAWLWNELKTDTSEEDLVEKMCANFEALTPDEARSDLHAFLKTITPAIEL